MNTVEQQQPLPDGSDYTLEDGRQVRTVFHLGLDMYRVRFVERGTLMHSAVCSRKQLTTAILPARFKARFKCCYCGEPIYTTYYEVVGGIGGKPAHDSCYRQRQE